MKKKPQRGKGLTYAQAGVNIDEADAAKETITEALGGDSRVIDAGKWAFASLFDARFPGYEHPVLVLKTEEPGSKQILAFKHDRIESICQDMIHHLINDIVVMGATPLSVQDCVVCGKLEKNAITRIVKAIAKVCKEQGCVLTGGETSEQPGVLEKGTYVLTSSIIGVAERAKIIDGSTIAPGDRVLAIASNGLHTNGYTLVRALLKRSPALAKKKVKGVTFLNAILKPHTCYYGAVKGLLGKAGLHGMAHITGSGIQGNLERILPKTTDARIHLDRIRILPVFRTIRDAGKVSDPEMLRTYNMGVGLTAVVSPREATAIRDHIRSHGHECYDIGEIIAGKGAVKFTGELDW